MSNSKVSNKAETKPVIQFTDKEQVLKYLDEWQNILYLNNWILDCDLVEFGELVEEGTGDLLHGRINQDIIGKNAVITLAQRPKDNMDNLLVRYCEEETLVHELLHLKLNMFKAGNESLPNIYYDTLEHSNLEFLARSLICSKYHIDPKWFKNVG